MVIMLLPHGCGPNATYSNLVSQFAISSCICSFALLCATIHTVMGKSKTTKNPLTMQGAVPPPYMPDSLPSSPVFTNRGWVRYDKWGRVQKLEPQPDKPSECIGYTRLPEYRDLRERFLFLPPCPMLTDQARKKKIALANHKMKTFFLPHREKRRLEIKEICSKRAEKLTKKQKQMELDSSAAFARAFADGVTTGANNTGEATDIPGPPTDESESESEFELS